MERIDVKVNIVEKFLSVSIFHFFEGECLNTRAITLAIKKIKKISSNNITRSMPTLES